MAPNLTVFGLLAIGLLSLTAKALEFRSDDNFHPSFENHHHLVRRKVGRITSPGPLEYMKQLRESMEKRFGEPKDVWCLLDRGKLLQPAGHTPRGLFCLFVSAPVIAVYSLLCSFYVQTLSMMSSGPNPEPTDALVRRDFCSACPPSCLRTVAKISPSPPLFSDSTCK